MSHHPYRGRIISPPTKYPIRKEGPNREGTASLPASGGQGRGWLAWLTYVNSHLNVVTHERPKMLGRSQHGNAAGAEGTTSSAMGMGSDYFHAAGEQREPKPSLSFKRNVVSPYASRKGQPSASGA